MKGNSKDIAKNLEKFWNITKKFRHLLKKTVR